MKARKTSEGQKTEDVASVKALASQAVTVLAARRAERQSDMSRKLLQDLVDAVLEPDGAAVERAVEHMQRLGIRNDQILGTFIPEAARQLGEAWCSDGLGFAEVTIGTARLQRALHGLTSKPAAGENQTLASILVIVPADEHHTLGALVMTEQLRCAGVSVRLCMGEPTTVAAERVATGQYQAIFVSIAAEEKLAGLRSMVNTLRRASPSHIPIVVGGAIGLTGAKVTGTTGADYSENDPFEALRLCGLTISANDTAGTVV